MFYIAAMKKRNRNENYLIELEWAKSLEILQQFNIKDDYDILVQSLEILDNRLVLLNPNVNTDKIVKKRRGNLRGSQSQQRMRFKKKANGSPYRKPAKISDRRNRNSDGNENDNF